MTTQRDRVEREKDPRPDQPPRQRLGEGYAILWPGGHAIVTKRQTYEAVESH